MSVQGLPVEDNRPANGRTFKMAAAAYCRTELKLHCYDAAAASCTVRTVYVPVLDPSVYSSWTVTADRSGSKARPKDV